MARVWGRMPLSTKNVFCLWFVAISAKTVAFAVGVASSNMNELAIAMADSDKIIVWKLTNDSRRLEKVKTPG